MARFIDRSQAGQRLADLLHPQLEQLPVVLALPRGGIAVAAQIAPRFSLPLDVYVVKKIPAPSNEEFAVGAVSEDGTLQWNEKYGMKNRSGFEQLEKTANAKLQEAQKQSRFYRERISPHDWTNRPVIVVDDGLATGVTLELALKEIRRKGASHITVALPVAAQSSLLRLKDLADEWIVALTPKNFRAVGDWYEDFSQLSIEDARQILTKSQPNEAILNEIHRLAKPLEKDFQINLLAEQAASARIVVLGQSVPGVKELSHFRRRLSQVLIQDHGFNLIALDADPSVGRELNRWTRGSRDPSKTEMIDKFPVWPRWLYMNEEMPPLLETMHRKKADFFGLDVYSFAESMATLSQLRTEGKSPRQILNQLCSQLDSRLIRMGLATPELFDLKHNFQIIEEAEKYYGQLLSENPDLHLLRDSHLFETLSLLLKNKGPNGKIILWSHDLQAGDSDFRSGAGAAPSLGQRLRETFGYENVCLIGMGAAEGSRLAAVEWGGTEEQFLLSNPKGGDIENHLAEFCREWNWNQIGLFFDKKSRQGCLSQKRPQRLISVVHEEDHDDSKKIPTNLSCCYDAYLFVCHGTALQARPPLQLAFEDVLGRRLNRRLKPEGPPSPAK